MESRLVEKIRRTEPGVEYIGLFGSRARGVHFLDSDIDLILSGNISSSKEKLRRLVEENCEVPKADIYVLERKHMTCSPINPKISTMGLDLKELYRSPYFEEVRFDVAAVDAKAFCAFLEYERLRNLEIFSEKELTLDYMKKMPGGRRSYDEIIWLSKLGGQDHSLDENLQQHLHNLRRKTIDVDLGDSITQYSERLDEIALTLEKELISGLESFQARGSSVLGYLSPEVELARSATEASEISDCYEEHRAMKGPVSWLTIYAAAFNPHIGEEIADQIASMDRKEVFDVELKKSLLQNRSIRERRHRRTLTKLTEDRDALVRTYAKIVRNPNYLKTLPANTKKFLEENTNHLA